MKLIFIILTLSVISYTNAQQQKPMIQEKTEGQCSNGWTITSAADCDEAAKALGWSDVVVSSGHTYSSSYWPPGCYLFNGDRLDYNTLTTSTMPCSSTNKCACSITCQPGTYQDEDGQTTCKSCTAGFYQQVAGKSECQACSTNTYSPLGASSCDYTSTTCPAGTYATGTAACTLCENGKYHDLTGQTSAAACKTCPNGVVNDDRTACGQKPVYPEKMSGKCDDLAGGSSIASIAECNQAAVGLGFADLVVDSVNTFSASGHPPGCYLHSGVLVYNTLTTSTMPCTSSKICACSILCPPGTYQDEYGQTSCKSCTAGYSPHGASSCDYTATTCPAGTYATGTAECAACTGDTYSTAGASSCEYTTCPAGTEATGTAACEACPSGTYQDEDGQTTCKACAAGFYQQVTGQGECTLCENGKYHDLTGQTSAAVCKTCRGVTNDDRTVCSQKPVYPEKTNGQCSEGSSITSVAECNQAAAALGWRSGAGLRTLSTYPPGCVLHISGVLVYNTLTTSTMPCSSWDNCACSITCQPGTYQDAVNQTTCKACAAGKYQPEEGQAECKSCSTLSVHYSSMCDCNSTTQNNACDAKKVLYNQYCNSC